MVGSRTIKNLDDFLVGPTELGAWIGVSAEWVRQLTVEGVLTRKGRGQYSLKASVRAYADWLRADQRRASKSAADSRLKDERARRESLRTAREERDLIPLTDALAAVEFMVGLVRSEVGSLPARLSRDTAERQRIEQETNGVLTRVADGLAEQSAALRSGGEADPADAEDDAGGVGEEE